jgi:epsilon-lactone hydrolase
MASKQIETVKTLYRSWTAAQEGNPNMSLDERRDMMEGWAQLTGEPGRTDYLEVEAGGVSAMWIVPKESVRDRIILGLHGGGFVVGSMYTHRKLFGHLARRTGVRALVLDYRRSPEHVHPAAVHDVVAAYQWLLEQGIEPGHIAIAGDSAGGALSIAGQLLARERNLPLPAGSMLMSPWVDLEVSGGSWVTNKSREVLFTPELMRGLAKMFLGQAGNPRDPLANPLYADLAGLPPLYIQVGGDEGLLDDSRRLAERARNAGVDVRLDIIPEMQHVFQMCAGRAPEADTAVEKFASWIRHKLGLDGVSDSISGTAWSGEGAGANSGKRSKPTSQSVLIIGFDPQYLDFSSPELAPLKLSAEKIMAGFAAETERLRSLGYEPEGCLVDLGETAENAVASRLRAQRYDCVIIGAGIRANPKYFLLFERLLNVVHELAPKARIGFNTSPTDTVAAVQRWL